MEKLMKISVKNNIKEATRGLSKIHREQVPFATSNAINMTLFQLRKEMGKQTTKHLDRPTPFTQKGFLVETAKKTTLKGMLFLKEAVEKYLRFQIDGGTRVTGKHIPIPYKPNARLNKFGNIIGKRSGLVKKSNQFIGEVNGILGVWERRKVSSSTTAKSPLKLVIAFTKSVDYKPRFPFYKISEMFTKNKFDRNFTRAFNKAVRSSR
tara:strand:- start:43 stop:666 length:624 start_codon:yes stop_codon:yes gene_type:complete